MWQCGDTTLAWFGGILIYINSFSQLGEVVRRTKMLDFLAANRYTGRFPANIEGRTPA
jgi:hypothetical protein